MALCTLIGCAQTVHRSVDLGSTPGITQEIISGTPGLQHLVYRLGETEQASLLRVYLSGDGTPWLTRRQISKDPTPRNPVALRLMIQDPGPSIYLGRPCYHRLTQARGCSPWLWTHGRYSEAVVSSMVKALSSAIGAHTEIELVGYSGGGVLAMLMASRLNNVRRVITVAANLDTERWTRHHSYSRLDDSLNPATQPPLSNHIRQIHLAGTRDLNVPPHLSRTTAERQPNAQFLLLPGFDHHCCWEQRWPSILGTIDKNDAHLNQTGVPPMFGELHPESRQYSKRIPAFTLCSV